MTTTSKQKGYWQLREIMDFLKGSMFGSDKQVIDWWHEVNGIKPQTDLPKTKTSILEHRQKVPGTFI